ncbi:MAG: peptidase MA family metallohydrolase [Chloroflexota bacterium]
MMKKTASLVILTLLCLVAILSPAPVQAQGISVLGSSAQADFPASLNFSLSARSGGSITEARLHYQVDRESFADVTSEVFVDFTPGPIVNLQYSLDMRRTGGLPPGSKVTYWWTLRDNSGGTVATAPTTVPFDDTRYQWRQLTGGKVTLYWYQGDNTFAQALMAAVQDGLQRLARNTGAAPERPAYLYVYASAGDLQGAMIYPQEWTGGVAYTSYSTMAIGIAPDNLVWGERAITHELTHLVVHQITMNPYNDLPTWLDEGLAMYTEGLLEPQFGTPLHQAVTTDSLISVRSLASPFSAFTGESILSYAQSYSLVEFLVSRYGQPKMLEMLNTFRQGSTYDGALQKVYGFDQDGLNTRWREYVRQQYQVAGGGQPQALAPATAAPPAAVTTRLLMAPGLTTAESAWRQGR